jgi:hypothetical protein
LNRDQSRFEFTSTAAGMSVPGAARFRNSSSAAERSPSLYPPKLPGGASVASIASFFASAAAARLHRRAGS